MPGARAGRLELRPVGLLFPFRADRVRIEENGGVPVITLETWIAAPINLCFDLARDIDLHMQSTAPTREVAVAGVTKGLIGPDEEVTWEATHLGVRQRLTSRVTDFNRPFHFRDSQVQGAFRRFDHDHFFTEADGSTLMRDVFDFDSPFGFLGSFANYLFLTRYMTALLNGRNRLIKQVAESATKRCARTGS